MASNSSYTNKPKNHHSPQTIEHKRTWPCIFNTKRMNGEGVHEGSGVVSAISTKYSSYALAVSFIDIPEKTNSLSMVNERHYHTYLTHHNLPKQ